MILVIKKLEMGTELMVHTTSNFPTVVYRRLPTMLMETLDSLPMSHTKGKPDTTQLNQENPIAHLDQLTQHLNHPTLPQKNLKKIPQKSTLHQELPTNVLSLHTHHPDQPMELPKSKVEYR